MKTVNLLPGLKTCVLAAAAVLFIFSYTAAGALPPLPVRVDAPAWLEESVRGSMKAVWRELQASRLPRESSLNALALVASRLFPGYRVTLRGGTVVIKPEDKWNWETEIEFPEYAQRLPGSAREWLSHDMEQALPLLGTVVKNVPPEALGWGSGIFHSKISDIISENIPGWRCAAKISVDGHDARLKVSIYPDNPLLLAVTPETLSSTMPQLIADRISEKTLEYMSPFTGLPLAWVEHHAFELTDWLSSRQLSDNWLGALRASSQNTLSLKPVTKVNTRIESTTFSLRGWVSGHAGSSARIEAGVHAGHFFPLTREIPAEVYTEVILGLEDWDLDGRLGLRFSPWGPVWLGIEGVREGEEHVWFRLWVTPEDTDLYGWLRYGEKDSVETAIGYRLNRYVSLELHYDSREDDRLSIRALSNL